MYIYESHLGSIYATKEPQDDKSLYCEVCWDSDRLLGRANTVEETIALLDEDEWNMENVRIDLEEYFILK